MNNFDFLIHLENTNRISNNENQLCYDNGYISYFRALDLNHPINIIKNTLLQKIIEKQIIYKNSSYLEQINNCIGYCIENLKKLNENKIYSTEEINQVNETIEFIIKENNKINILIEEKMNQDNKTDIVEENVSILIEEEKSLLNNETNINSNINKNTNNLINHSLCEKFYSISIKIKKAIQSGFKRTFNYIKDLWQKLKK